MPDHEKPRRTMLVAESLLEATVPVREFIMPLILVVEESLHL